MSTAQFDKAVAIVRSLPPNGSVKPTQEQQLEFYGLFKQATEGDVKGDRPGAFNFAGKYKWDAWKKLEGTSQDDAKAKYVALLKGVSIPHLVAQLPSSSFTWFLLPRTPAFMAVDPIASSVSSAKADNPDARGFRRRGRQEVACRARG